MKRTVDVKFINHNFADSDFVDITSILGVSVVHAIEIRNTQGTLEIRTSDRPTHVETYKKDEIYQLHENLRTTIRGFNLEKVQIKGGAGDLLRGEYHL